MTDDVPQIASTLERTKLLLPLCLMLLQWPLMVQRPNPFGLLLFLGCLYTTVNVARILSTHLTAAGISQFTWRGRVQMRWEDVTAVSRRNRSILLSSGERSVSVPTESFYDTRAAVDYLDSHLPRHLRQH